MKAQLISSPICQIDTNLLLSINYFKHEYSSFWGGDLMIKATADRNPELIKIPSHTPSLNVHATFQTRFITVLPVM